MPSVRTPTASKILKGSFRTSPEKRLEPIPTVPLGFAPKYFKSDERDAWNEIRAISPDGVLFNSDRLVVEVASLILAKLRRREQLSPSEWNRLGNAISMIGGTPADRARIQARPKEKEENFDFLN